ncbi:uncharacterized protein DEA37_0003095, partial [Paragonimus westermani]
MIIYNEPPRICAFPHLIVLSTRTCVGFDGFIRMVGYEAMGQFEGNVKNTFDNFLPLIGKLFNDNVLRKEQEYLLYQIVESEDKRVSIPVGAYLCARYEIVCSTVALCYGFYVKGLPSTTESPRVVLFICIGYTSTQIAAFSLRRDLVKLLKLTYRRNLGGRDFDRVLFNQLKSRFGERSDELSHLAQFRLRDTCQKVKIKLSAHNENVPVRLDYLVDNKHLNTNIRRPDFEDQYSPEAAEVQELTL